MLTPGEINHAEQFVHPEAAKLEDETVSDATTQQKIDRVAE
jgi:hypothetical protein